MNKNKTISFIIVVVLVAAAIFFTIKNKGNNTSREVQQTPAEQTTTEKYTMAEVATHKDQSSCWTTINGNVYDVTTWISQHPGGAEAILGLCGIDGSVAFNGQHGGQGDPERELATFKIGTLVSN